MTDLSRLRTTDASHPSEDSEVTLLVSEPDTEPVTNGHSSGSGPASSGSESRRSPQLLVGVVLATLVFACGLLVGLVLGSSLRPAFVEDFFHHSDVEAAQGTALPPPLSPVLTLSSSSVLSSSSAPGPSSSSAPASSPSSSLLEPASSSSSSPSSAPAPPPSLLYLQAFHQREVLNDNFELAFLVNRSRCYAALHDYTYTMDTEMGLLHNLKDQWPASWPGTVPSAYWSRVVQFIAVLNDTSNYLGLIGHIERPPVQPHFDFLFYTDLDSQVNDVSLRLEEHVPVWEQRLGVVPGGCWLFVGDASNTGNSGWMLLRHSPRGANVRRPVVAAVAAAPDGRVELGPGPVHGGRAHTPLPTQYVQRDVPYRRVLDEER